MDQSVAENSAKPASGDFIEARVFLRKLAAVSTMLHFLLVAWQASY